MTHRFPRVAMNVEVKTYEPLYSLFTYKDRKWIRIRSTCFPIKIARIVWKEAICNNPLSMDIRIVQVQSDKAEGSTHFSRVHYQQHKEFVPSLFQELQVPLVKRS